MVAVICIYCNLSKAEGYFDWSILSFVLPEYTLILINIKPFAICVLYLFPAFNKVATQ